MKPGVPLLPYIRNSSSKDELRYTDGKRDTNPVGSKQINESVPRKLRYMELPLPEYVLPDLHAYSAFEKKMVMAFLCTITEDARVASLRGMISVASVQLSFDSKPHYERSSWNITMKPD